VEVASEYRYRRHVVPDSALFVTISQSGETADTLAALRLAKASGYAATLAICNCPESSLVRESDLILLTHAGPEIGVASTKAFTTQLVALLLLTLALGRCNRLDAAEEERLVAQIRTFPARMEQVLALDPQIAELAERFVDKQHTLFLGRGEQYPIAMEGALKLKEISYIHAEAYPAGELKHGPLALIDENMPVVAVQPGGGPGQGRSALCLRRLPGPPARGRDAAGDPAARERGTRRSAGLHGPASAPRLPCRRAQGDGRGPAAEPRQVGHGRVIGFPGCDRVGNRYPTISIYWARK
jgi:hypothetical protein